VRSATVALLLVGALAMAFVACAATPHTATNPNKDNEITALWAQIRDWRREAHMQLDPTRSDVFQWDSHTVQEAARVCRDNHPVPRTCNDVCSLSDNICDNAEAICGIAAELGPGDDYAAQKCASAKASCREAKQQCCKCADRDDQTP